LKGFKNGGEKERSAQSKDHDKRRDKKDNCAPKNSRKHGSFQKKKNCKIKHDFSFKVRIIAPGVSRSFFYC